MNGTYTINVGKGGAVSMKGSNSQIIKNNIVLYSCEGGGNGGYNGANATDGGCGGGGQWSYNFGIANDPTKGFNGQSSLGDHRC